MCLAPLVIVHFHGDFLVLMFPGLPLGNTQNKMSSTTEDPSRVIYTGVPTSELWGNLLIKFLLLCPLAPNSAKAISYYFG